MLLEDLNKALSEVIMDLKPAPIPDEVIEFKEVTLDRSEVDNSKWVSYITVALKDAKTFEIHCWNEEAEWIELALEYGSLKDDDWRHGKIITGDVTQIDLPWDKTSGLKDAIRVLEDVKDIAICKLTSADVVRHALVQRIINAYEKAEQKKEPVKPNSPKRYQRKQS